MGVKIGLRRDVGVPPYRPWAVTHCPPAMRDKTYCKEEQRLGLETILAGVAILDSYYLALDLLDGNPFPSVSLK